MKQFSKKLILGISLAITGILLISQLAFAAPRTTVIVFCTEWNAKCRTAVPAIESIVSSYNGQFDVQQFNIDLNTTPERARAMGINIPSRIPHVVVIDRNGKIVFQQDYSSQTPTQLRQTLDSLAR
ncbi:MAG: hypothetical protein ACD_20C00022G0003 [uncultured bacterium]|nr:MAG: hypothetical protein ACD_20C00022G0003 [uncultured bacterium]HBH18285.1 hypothetical protein [Cyanobacteria bacterium UBA9579]